MVVMYMYTNDHKVRKLKVAYCLFQFLLSYSLSLRAGLVPFVVERVSLPDSAGAKRRDDMKRARPCFHRAALATVTISGMENVAKMLLIQQQRS